MSKIKKMKKGSKRRQNDPLSSSSSTKNAKTINIKNPYPDHLSPTPDECREVRDILLSHNGFPKQFIKYRQQRLQLYDKNEPFGSERNSGLLLDAEINGEDLGSTESVLDGLVSTILSQNTTDVNSQKAFASLKSAFPTWKDVLAAESKQVEEAIRCGGLAPSKTACIKNLLDSLFKKRGNLCLEYLRDLSVEEIKAELSHFKGIGPKTVACVLMFNLQRDDFPVDTHVLQIAKTIGWLPLMANLEKAYLHLNSHIPNHLKFELNCLLFSHGKVCRQCSKVAGCKPKKESCENPCPLLNTTSL